MLRMYTADATAKMHFQVNEYHHYEVVEVLLASAQYNSQTTLQSKLVTFIMKQSVKLRNFFQ